MLEPIPEIWVAAELLLRAVDAHRYGKTKDAEALFREADIPAIAVWTESIWGKGNRHVWRFRSVPNSPPRLPDPPKPRNPTAETRRQVKQRDGFFCRFCGIPVIEARVRQKIRSVYPGVLRWGSRNAEQHAAFQCMWLQYDHILPNCRGGESSVDNVVVTCAPCNNGHGNWTLEEVGLIDPRTAFVVPTWRLAESWCGLEDFK
jgi:5-methylcytosine-specific restriction endonuclease McrA